MTLTKKTILLYTVIPTFILAILDVMTTYIGVCYYGGIELNTNAIRKIQNYGFIIGSLDFIVVKSLIAGMFGIFLWSSRKDQFAMTFTIVLLVLFLTDFANTVVLNTNVLMYQTFGKGFAPRDESARSVTPLQAEEIEKTFVREEFCRLI